MIRLLCIELSNSSLRQSTGICWWWSEPLIVCANVVCTSAHTATNIPFCVYDAHNRTSLVVSSASVALCLWAALVKHVSTICE